MGRLEGGSAKLFYEFSLEEMVPQNHLLRGQVFFIAVHRSGLLWATTPSRPRGLLAAILSRSLRSASPRWGWKTYKTRRMLSLVEFEMVTKWSTKVSIKLGAHQPLDWSLAINQMWQTDSQTWKHRLGLDYLSPVLDDLRHLSRIFHLKWYNFLEIVNSSYPGRQKQACDNLNVTHLA